MRAFYATAGLLLKLPFACANVLLQSKHAHCMPQSHAGHAGLALQGS